MACVEPLQKVLTRGVSKRTIEDDANLKAIDEVARSRTELVYSLEVKLKGRTKELDKATENEERFLSLLYSKAQPSA